MGTRRTHTRLLAVCAALGLSALTLMLTTATASAATAPTKPSLQKDNDANRDGVFTDTENVPKGATYPFAVTYRLTIAAGTFSSHLLNGISDDLTMTLISSAKSPSCASLIGTTIPAGSTTTCYYDILVAGPTPVPLVNTATIHWDSGLDTASNTSTVDFPALSLEKSSTTSLVTAVGQVVPYSYVVRNTGSVTVSGIAVSDDNTDGAPSCPQASLVPAASMTCTAQHTVVPGEISAGSVNNTATASSSEAADVSAKLSIPTVAPTKPSV